MPVPGEPNRVVDVVRWWPRTQLARIGRTGADSCAWLFDVATDGTMATRAHRWRARGYPAQMLWDFVGGRVDAVHLLIGKCKCQLARNKIQYIRARYGGVGCWRHTTVVCLDWQINSRFCESWNESRSQYGTTTSFRLKIAFCVITSPNVAKSEANENRRASQCVHP